MPFSLSWQKCQTEVGESNKDLLAMLWSSKQHGWVSEAGYKTAMSRSFSGPFSKAVTYISKLFLYKFNPTNINIIFLPVLKRFDQFYTGYSLIPLINSVYAK